MDTNLGFSFLLDYVTASAQAGLQNVVTQFFVCMCFNCFELGNLSYATLVNIYWSGFLYVV